jgi:hypothetical protein
MWNVPFLPRWPTVESRHRTDHMGDDIAAWFERHVNPLTLVAFGLACALGMLATVCLVAVYLAVLGNFSALFGVAIAAWICVVLGLMYKSLRRR